MTQNVKNGEQHKKNMAAIKLMAQYLRDIGLTLKANPEIYGLSFNSVYQNEIRGRFVNRTFKMVFTFPEITLSLYHTRGESKRAMYDDTNRVGRHIVDIHMPGSFQTLIDFILKSDEAGTADIYMPTEPDANPLPWIV